MSVDLSKTKKLIKKYGKKKGILIPLLQDIQREYGYVPKETVELVAKELNIFPIQIYGILTFYAQFYLTPRGKHIIRVCQGTACHVMGGKELLNYVSEKLGIKVGETTKDGIFSLERVACLGCCGMAPVIVVDNDFYGNCTYQKIDDFFKKYKPGRAK
jgi:NADH-quinone oxidoreductase subunit E